MKVNPLDLLAASLILIGLFGVTKHKNFWLVYAMGCLLWIQLSISVGYYGGAVMNIIAMLIALKNWSTP